MSLNRKAMVLAVGAALAAPGAYAQVKSPAGSDWEFYGKFYPEMTHISGDTPSPVGTTVSTLSAAATGTTTLVNRNEMLVGNSYLGFRGSKAIGSGMRMHASDRPSEGRRPASCSHRTASTGTPSSAAWKRAAIPPSPNDRRGSRLWPAP